MGGGGGLIGILRYLKRTNSVTPDSYDLLRGNMRESYVFLMFEHYFGIITSRFSLPRRRSLGSSCTPPRDKPKERLRKRLVKVSRNPNKPL